jgi:hypothetical protein
MEVLFRVALTLPPLVLGLLLLSLQPPLGLLALLLLRAWLLPSRPLGPLFLLLLLALLPRSPVRWGVGRPPGFSRVTLFLRPMPGALLCLGNSTFVGTGHGRRTSRPHPCHAYAA